MANYKLTDYGTIIDCNDKENNLDYYLKKWKNKGITLYFSSDNNTFELDGKSLVLSEKQRELLNQKRPSSEVSKLIAYSEECQYKKREEIIEQRFLDTGEFPTDTEELAILNEYYRKKLSSTNVSILKNAIQTSVMPLTMAVTSYFSYSLLSPDEIFGKVLFGSLSLLLGFCVSMIPGLIMEGNDLDPLPIGDVIEGIRKRGVLKSKIKYLDKSKEKRTALEAEKAFTPEGLENKEINTLADNSNVFLQELEVVKKRIAKLPEEEREPYIRELVRIVTSYDLQVTAILNRDANKIMLGSANNLWDLNVSMLPCLYDLGGRLDQRLATIEKRQELKETLEQTRNSIEALDTYNGYTEGYTDGYTDDLTAGGVAFAGASKKSC